jgi:Mg/Co/Ni transporter MgtE
MTNVELEMDRYKYILNLRDNVLQRSIPKEIISKYSEFTQMMSDTLSTEVIKTLKQMTSYQIKELLKELQKKHTELFIRMTNVELEMDTLELRYKELHAASTKI